jgi:uronate dehydrogenase
VNSQPNLSEVELLSPVLITGANGYMGRSLRAGLRDQVSTLRLMTKAPLTDLHPNEENVVADLRDREGVGRALEGVQAVVHLAGLPDEASFGDILDTNIVGAHNLYEAAREHGVKRVVFASSNHTIGFYPRTTQLRPEDPPRPDTYYGVSKVFGEALARLYWDKWGIESACLRIGSFRERPEDHRQLSTWLSHRDGIELVSRCLQAPEVGFATIFGVSANLRSWWDIGDDARRIGYQPQDDAERYAGSIPGPSSTPGATDLAAQLQGGAYVASDYTGGLWPPRPAAIQSDQSGEGK